jgi:twitching motility protein PilT
MVDINTPNTGQPTGAQPPAAEPAAVPATASASAPAATPEPAAATTPPAPAPIPTNQPVAATQKDAQEAFDINKLFRTAAQYGASDIYISVGIKPTLRIHGSLYPIDAHPVLSKQIAEKYLLQIMTKEQQAQFTKNMDIDFSVEIKGIGRFRANVFVQNKGIGGVFRLIASKIKSMDELALPEQLKKIPHFPNGLVLVTGPTGSGKSTTLASIINEINTTQSKHILTIEDPIEFIHENQKSVVEQREVGAHTKSFKNALRGSLREDPDVILVGEMRDLETIALAITAAETGHLVFGTLHTSGAAKSVDRIIDVFPTDQQSQVRVQVAELLRCVIWQNLLPTKDGKGRVAAHEIMFNNHAIANMIRKQKTYQIQSILETGVNEGMQSMARSINDLLQKDLITQEIAQEHVPEEFEEGTT